MTYAPSSTSVCVLGLGYIGLPTASLLATKGFRVLGIDVRSEVVETINRGRIHIVESNLDILVRSAVNSGQLRAASSPEPADVFMICVPTPLTPQKTADLEHVRSAAAAIRPHIRSGNLVILESTCPPGTTRDFVGWAIPDGMTVGRDVFVAHCPERVLPGRILLELVENDRIVGGVTPACARQARLFYERFVDGAVHETTAIVAEMTKVAENAYRDVNIAFANELSMLADSLGVSVWEVIGLANRHPRVNILKPGPGVGGHCISVDPWFLVQTAPELMRLTRTAREVNDAKIEHVVRQIRAAAARFDHPVIGCLGLTYKADVDDLRESPALKIVERLRDQPCGELLVCDPYVTNLKGVRMVSAEELARRSNVVALLTDHSAFRNLDAPIRDKAVVDARGAWQHSGADRYCS
jgi:UDP-N-acetyl-D-mannosaminuronic acid dehydrogenase